MGSRYWTEASDAAYSPDTLASLAATAAGCEGAEGSGLQQQPRAWPLLKPFLHSSEL